MTGRIQQWSVTLIQLTTGFTILFILRLLLELFTSATRPHNFLDGCRQVGQGSLDMDGDNQTNGHGLIVGVVEFEELQCCFNCISFTSNSNRKLHHDSLFADTCTWTWGPTLESRSGSCPSPTSSLAPQSLMSLTSTLATSQKGRN